MGKACGGGRRTKDSAMMVLRPAMVREVKGSTVEIVNYLLEHQCKLESGGDA